MKKYVLTIISFVFCTVAFSQDFFCGGSGCAEKTYTIIDATTLMIELVPIQMKNNAKIAEKLLGKPIKKNSKN